MTVAGIGYALTRAVEGIVAWKVRSDIEKRNQSASSNNNQSPD
jgi:hypothetical protein